MKNTHLQYLTLAILFINLYGCQPSEETQTSHQKKQYDFNIDLQSISVSGVSAGGYMATQFHIAHSAKISGVAIIAGGPYWCAQNSISRALGYCMKGGGGTNPLLINQYIEKSQHEQLIDNTSNLKNDKVWIFHGAKDIIMAHSVSRAIKDLYMQYTNPDNITTVYDIPVNHGMPTLATGGKCDAIDSSFLNACNYDAAGEILKTFYGALNDRGNAYGQLIEVDQTQFNDAQFTDSGYLYVPNSCKNNKTCRLHTVFHGCMQSSEFIGDTFIKGAGYNEWAETNDIVVFYPQINSSKFSPLNPKGCWDWWGYTSEDYANKNGAQIAAINNMIDKISGVK